MVKKFFARVIERSVIAEDTCELVFDIKGFNFIPGQYVTLTLPDLKRLPVKETFRDFSIASTPDDEGRITIAFRKSDSAFKQRLLDEKNPPEVEIEGPKGVFTLDPTSAHSVFIAGGIGITPFLSMTRHLARKKTKQSITLFYANSSVERSAYLKELQDIDKQHKNINLISILGHFHDGHLKEFLQPGHSPEIEWYIAGPPAMVGAVRTILFQNGIDDAKINTEAFTGYL